jgi:hypothetical protein
VSRNVVTMKVRMLACSSFVKGRLGRITPRVTVAMCFESRVTRKVWARVEVRGEGAKYRSMAYRSLSPFGLRLSFSRDGIVPPTTLLVKSKELKLNDLVAL